MNLRLCLSQQQVPQVAGLVFRQRRGNPEPAVGVSPKPVSIYAEVANMAGIETGDLVVGAGHGYQEVFLFFKGKNVLNYGYSVAILLIIVDG